MKTNKLIKFFENEGFSVHLFEQDKKQCAELEVWTNGGVDMIIVLNPITEKEFINYVDNFEVDEEIDLHRQDERYKNAFSISESVKDFTDFYNWLKEIKNKLEK
jgi:5,10-methenyltetrahydromethanopterin hydrogenase